MNTEITAQNIKEILEVANQETAKGRGAADPKYDHVRKARAQIVKLFGKVKKSDYVKIKQNYDVDMMSFKKTYNAWKTAVERVNKIKAEHKAHANNPENIVRAVTDEVLIDTSEQELIAFRDRINIALEGRSKIKNIENKTHDVEAALQAEMAALQTEKENVKKEALNEMHNHH